MYININDVKRKVWIPFKEYPRYEYIICYSTLSIYINICIYTYQMMYLHHHLRFIEVDILCIYINDVRVRMLEVKTT